MAHLIDPLVFPGVCTPDGLSVSLLFLRLGQAAGATPKLALIPLSTLAHPTPNSLPHASQPLQPPDIYQKNRLEVPQRDLRSGVDYRAEREQYKV
jgi:hypothetical protein